VEDRYGPILLLPGRPRKAWSKAVPHWRNIISTTWWYSYHGCDKNKFLVTFTCPFLTLAVSRSGWSWLCTWSYRVGRRKSWDSNKSNKSWINESSKVNWTSFILLGNNQDCIELSWLFILHSQDEEKQLMHLKLMGWRHFPVKYRKVTARCWNSWMWSCPPAYS
jgi:hypothetical protein